MEIHHGGGYATVTKRILNGANIGSRLQQVRGKGMAEGMSSHPRGDVGFYHCLPELPTHGTVIQVITRHLPGSWMLTLHRGWKDPLPNPLGGAIRRFAKK